MIRLIGRLEYPELIVDETIIRRELQKYRSWDTKQVVIGIERYAGPKSRAALGFYFAGVVRTLAEYLSISEKECHALLKIECNPVEMVVFRTGEIVKYGGPVADMNAGEFRAYIDRCIVYAAQTGCQIFTPEEYYKKLDTPIHTPHSLTTGR